jgi:large subunit ribosomal protein L30
MTARAASSKKTLEVRQVKSGIGYNRRQKLTLRALGLEKVGRVRVLPDNPQVRGMLGKIPHLVEVNESPARGK